MRAAVLLGAMVMVSCSHNNKAAPPDVVDEVERGTVVLEGKGQTVRVAVEVVRTPEKISRGLMYRKSLGAHKGMLFIFPEEKLQSFWMKNTYIPLDMLFINKQLQVVGIVENAAPMTTTSRRVAAPSIYVLEVNGDFCRPRGIRAGTRVRLEGIRLP
jgi:uncharacterized membrane protein (UPF0127 family)